MGGGAWSRCGAASCWRQATAVIGEEAEMDCFSLNHNSSYFRMGKMGKMIICSFYRKKSRISNPPVDGVGCLHQTNPTVRQMVLISLKSTLPNTTTNDGFLFETTSSTPVTELIDSLVDIHNARLRCCLVVDAVRALATYGVMKKLEEAGTDEVRG
jgi:hypothetical protein